MKRLISLLIGCSLALTGAALAQQPVEQQSPSKSKRAPEKARATEAQPGANAVRSHEKAAKQTGAIKEHSATNEHERAATNERSATNEHERAATNERSAAIESRAEKGRKTHANPESATTEANASAKSSNETRNEATAEKGRKVRNHEESANARTETNVSGHTAETHRGKQQVEERNQGVKQSPTSAGTATNATQSGSRTGTGQQNAQANAGTKANKPNPQQVQQIKSQHTNFRAQPKPQQVPAVTFNQNHRVKGSDHWQGQQYQVFRSYQPQWHDQGWYRSHYSHVELIGGGYYYFNNGYWFPAWGYSASAQYYPYDGPIYVGHSAEPPDKVIADVQAELQQMGYYKGQVDGLLGPLTREALVAYQADQGLTTTAVIDQPTLDSLQLT